MAQAKAPAVTAEIKNFPKHPSFAFPDPAMPAQPINYPPPGFFTMQ
jgi:hypothetical protein